MSSGDKNTILTMTGDVSATESSYVTTLDSGSSSNKSVTLSHFIISVNSDGSIEYEKMSSEGSTTEGLVDVSKSKISVELENRKAWPASSKP